MKLSQINGCIHQNPVLFSQKSCAIPDIPFFFSIFLATVQCFSVNSIRKLYCYCFLLRPAFTKIVFYNLQNRRFQDDGEFEEIIYKRDTPLIWRSLKEFNLTESETCRNSEQGVNLITDERGFICTRDDLLQTGCCNIKADNTVIYNCKSCNDDHCCEIFENCVSCCLNPDNVSTILTERMTSNS